MSQISLYRKYRSQTFGDLIGQDHVVRTLQNGITSGRIAHAYLFTGPRGTGKTSSARLLAKALCCESGPSAEPDNTCQICQEITTGSFVDVIEMDAASEAGVEEVREKIVEVVQYLPMIARYKVFIIDEVHDLSAKAFDALLKTIEEPPPHVIFILATTEYNKVPPTIRSRCQKFEFHRATLQDLVNRLSYVAEQEGVEVEPAAVTAIARMADGGYRDALTLLEQAIITSDGKVTLEQVYDQLGLISDELTDNLLLALKGEDVPKILDLLNEVARRGRDPRAIVESLLHRLGDLTRAAYGIDVATTGDATQEATLHETASRLGRDVLLGIRSDLAEAHKAIRDVTLPRIWLEAELIRISRALNQAKTAPAVQTAVTQARPVAEAPKVVATPSPPKPEEKKPVAEEPAPTAANGQPKPEPPNDPAGAGWKAVVTELSAVSKLMAARLTDTRASVVQDKRITVEFGRTLDYEWVKDSPKRQGAITECVRKHLGPDWEVDLAVGKREAAPTEPQAVELPAEGAKLTDMVKQIFNVPN